MKFAPRSPNSLTYLLDVNALLAWEHGNSPHPRLACPLDPFADVSVTALQNRIQQLSPGERRSAGKYVFYVRR